MNIAVFLCSWTFSLYCSAQCLYITSRERIRIVLLFVTNWRLDQELNLAVVCRIWTGPYNFWCMASEPTISSPSAHRDCCSLIKDVIGVQISLSTWTQGDCTTISFEYRCVFRGEVKGFGAISPGRGEAAQTEMVSTYFLSWHPEQDHPTGNSGGGWRRGWTRKSLSDNIKE